MWPEHWRQPDQGPNRYKRKSGRRMHKPRQNGTPRPGTSSPRGSNTIRLRQKRCASDASSTNLLRAKSLCSFGKCYISNLAIFRIPECDYLVGTSHSLFQAPACLADRNAVKETDARLCVSQRHRNSPPSFHAPRQERPASPRFSVFPIGPFPSIYDIAQRYEIPEFEHALHPVVPL